MKNITLTKSENNFKIPIGYFWGIFFICVLPTIIAMLGVEVSFDNHKIITFSAISNNIPTTLLYGRTFTTIWVIFSIATGIFACILTLIDYRVKQSISSPIIGILLASVSVFDLIQLMILLGALKTKLELDQAIYLSWFISRNLHAILLIIASIVLIRYSNNKNSTIAQKKKILNNLTYFFAIVMICAVVFVFNVKKLPALFFNRDSFFTHPFEIIGIFLFLIWGAFLMPKILKKYDEIFFQLLILSLLPAIFASAHMAIYFKNFDIQYNFGQFLKMLTYIVPLIGISLNYSRNIAKQHQMNSILDGEIKLKERIQKDLERRQSLLQNAEKLANMGSWELDLQTKEINFSDALYKIFGYMPNSISPSLELMINMIVPSDRKSYQNLLNDAIANQTSFNTEYEVLWVNGERRYILAQCRYILEDKKIIGTCLDITELKEATNKLSQNEILLKEAEAISHNGSFEWFAGVDHFFWSEELFRIHGYEPNSIDINFSFYENQIHPDDLEKCLSTAKRVLDLKSDFSLEYRIIRPDGNIRYVYLTAKVLRDNDENISKIIGNIQDITELKNATLLLEQTESIYKTIASNVPDSVVLMYDRNFNLILSDGPIINKIKFKHDAIPGMNITELYHHEDAVEEIANLQRAFLGEEVQVERELQEGKTFMIDYKPVKNAAGETFNIMVVMHDITEIKKVQKNLQSKINELNRSNQDLEQFAYVASHDLQEPLRKIRSFGDRLQNKFSSSITEEGVDYIRRMQNASERMQTLIDDLLTFSRVTRTDEGFEDVDLHEEIKKIIEDLEYTIEKKNATIDFMVNHHVTAIPGQIRQLFQNFISNALKFNKPNESPIIQIKSEILRGELISPKLDAMKDYCRITIKDNGIGFDKQYVDKIFELFQRLHTRDEYQGTGIGLAVCKKIIEKHQGLILVDSEINSGSTFSIILPLTQPYA